ncbi:MAG: DegT/DnrJ/EryC1/StrS family aminotransferase [Patescibacteria group bacterium]|jgi:dTDP-4-amino-4,6-dideoxygalactose transaminase
MQFLDLTAQYKSIKKEINKAVNKVLGNAHFILGEEVTELEKEVAAHCGTQYAVGVNSGTDALLLALMALDIGPGDEVITTPFTFFATAEVIAVRGAKPIFVDIDPKTFNIDTDKIEEKITAKTKAIIPVHLYGQPCEMDKIMEIAKKHKLYVIEDCAQAIGAKYKGKNVGSFGEFGCLSFFPSKNLGAYGDGGMVLTNNEKLAEKIKMLRQHGSRKKYYHETLGVNSRLDALQAAILRVKLKYLNKWEKGRQQKAKKYNQNLAKIKGISIPYLAENNEHVYHQYTIRAQKRDELQQYLTQNNIPSVIYYPVPLHLQPVFKNLGFKEGDLPETEKAGKEVLSLPIYPELPEKNQKFIIEKIKEYYKKN